MLKGLNPRWARRHLGAPLICMLLATGAAGVRAQHDEHTALIARARSGQAELVLPELRIIAAGRKQDASLQADLLIVLRWAGRNDEALAHLETIKSLQLPHYVAATIIDIARDLRRYEPSLSVLNAMRIRAAGALALPLEIGRLNLLLASGDAIAALADCNELLARQQAPSTDLDQLLRVKVRLASTLQAYSIAMDIARTRPDLFEPDELIAIEQDWQAQRVKVGVAMQAARDDRSRLAVSDSAIASGYQRLEGNDADSAAFARSRYDQMLALRERRAMKEAIALFESITDAVPSFVTLAAADAYLAERQPLKAVQLYRKALADSSGEASWETRINLAYALLEAEQPQAALATVSAVRDEISVELAPGSAHEFDQGIRRWRLRAELNLANFERYTNQQQRSAMRLTRLLEWMPFDAEVRLSMAQTLSDRQSPRRAAQLIDRVANDFPDSLPAQMAQVDSAIALGDIAAARALLERLEQRLGEHPRLDSIRSELANDSAAIARLSIGWTLGQSNDALLSPPRERRVQASVESPLLNNRWRVIVSALQQQAWLADGQIERRRYALGANARFGDLSMTGALTTGASADGANHAGSWLRIGYALDDQWSLRLRLDRNSDDLPLRAYRAGITLNSAALDLEWRQLEHRALAASLERGRFTDGNERTVLSLGWRELWNLRPGLKFRTHLAAGNTVNTSSDTPYFSPSRFFDVSLALIAEQTLSRHYDALWRHRLTLAPGYFDQAGFTGRFGYVVRYEHDFEVRQRSVRVSLAQTRRPYDGVMESRWIAALELMSRFW